MTDPAQIEPVPREKLPDDWVDVGGVKRPTSDVNLSKSTDATSVNSARPMLKKPEGYAAPVPEAMNTQTLMVATALKENKNPERFSSFIVPRSFDFEAFKSDPPGYAAHFATIVEPGRVYASAQPGDGVPVIRSVGDRLHRVTQGEVVRLVVESAPNAPVTFTSHNLGRFSNSLTSITVVADAEGKVMAEFTASAGAKGKLDILAASPITSGQVNFVVLVSLGTKPS